MAASVLSPVRPVLRALAATLVPLGLLAAPAAAQAQFARHPVPSGLAEQLSAGPGGVWFASADAFTPDRIEHLVAVGPDGAMREQRLDRSLTGTDTRYLAVNATGRARDGTLWALVTSQGAGSGFRQHALHRQADGTVRSFPLAIDVNANVKRLVAGRDDAMYGVGNARRVLLRIAADGSARALSPAALRTASPTIAVGPDGAVWTTVDRAVQRVTSSGSVRTFRPRPTVFPSGIAAGGDGRLWFADIGARRMVAITTRGRTTRFCRLADVPRDPVAAPDGSVWFTLDQGNDGADEVARISRKGEVRSFGRIGPGRMLTEIAFGEDRALWAIEAAKREPGAVGETRPDAVLLRLAPGSPSKRLCRGRG